MVGEIPAKSREGGGAARAHPYFVLWSLAILGSILPQIWGQDISNDPSVVCSTTFAKPFYRAFKLQDWKAMRSLAGAEDRTACFDRWIATASLPATINVRNIIPRWDPRGTMDCEALIKMALSLVAARQGQEDPKAARLTERQRKEVRNVWLKLYESCLVLIGAPEDPVPTEHEEIQAKCTAAMNIGTLMGDNGAAMFGVLASAWYFERVGHIQESWALRKEFEDDVKGLKWPPISKNGGHYAFQVPNPPAK